MRTLYDQHKYKIFVSGSTSELSLERINSELRGRVINTLVLPSSFIEYLKEKRIVYKKYTTQKEEALIQNAMDDFIKHGGYPEVIKMQNIKLKKELLSQLYSSVIQRDIIEKYKIRKITIAKVFINSLFGFACRELSPISITRWFASQNIKVSNQTASNYINYTQNVTLGQKSSIHRFVFLRVIIT